MISIDQIREALQEVVFAKVSLDRFDEWFSRASWNMHGDSSPEAIKTVGQIELILSDYDNDLISEQDVVQAFQRLIPVFRLSNIEQEVVVRSFGGDGINPQPLSLPKLWVASDKQFSAVSEYTPAHRG